jgi:dihydroxyacetone kinase-like predicted kinase
MTVTIHAHTAKTIALIEKILMAGSFSFVEKENIDISAQDFRTMIKARKPRMVGKSLQNL